MGFPSPIFRTIIVFPFLRFFISFQCLYKSVAFYGIKALKGVFSFQTKTKRKSILSKTLENGYACIQKVPLITAWVLKNSCCILRQ